MVIRTPIIAAFAMTALAAGCASGPDPDSLGARLQAEGGEMSELGERWIEGEASIAEGGKLIARGKDRVEDGEDLVKDGRRAIARGEDRIADGEGMIRRGERMIREGEIAKRSVKAQTAQLAAR